MSTRRSLYRNSLPFGSHMYDLKIRNGTIVDGSGRPRFLGDLGVRAGRIIAVGDAADDAVREIDATGKVVSPGFIDIHTHYDVQLFWDRMLSTSPWQGVTTVVMGNCGFAIAPTREKDREFILRTLQHVEGIPYYLSLPAMGDWGFETFPQFLDLVEARGTAVNVAAQIGHTALRTWVMGVEENHSRAATPDELNQMRQITQEAIAAGAAGLTTTDSEGHFGEGGIPVPSRWATAQEQMALAQAVADMGTGRYQPTSGPVITWEFLLRVLDQTGVPIANPGGGGRDFVQMIETLHDLHYEWFPQFSVLPNVIWCGLDEPFIFALGQTSGVYAVKPADELFVPIMDLPTVEARLEAYRQPGFLERMVKATDRDDWNERYWPVIDVGMAPTRPEWEGRPIAEVAREQGRKPAEILYEICIESDLKARINIGGTSQAALDYKQWMFEEQDGLRIGLGDAGAHLLQICDARYPCNLLGYWVRERGVKLERAVRMLTSMEAEAFGILGRGTLTPGWAADITIFDPDTVIDGPLQEIFDLPGGSQRLISEPVGIEHVIVNGTVLREHGVDAVDPEGDLPGHLLRRFAPHPTRKRRPIPENLFLAARAMDKLRAARFAS